MVTEALQFLEEIAYLASCAVSAEDHRRLDLALRSANIDATKDDEEGESSVTDARPRLAA